MEVLDIFKRRYQYKDRNYSLHDFFYKKTIFFCLSSNFLNMTLENEAEIFLIFFLIFFSLFCLILCLTRFNTNSKSHFLKNGDRKPFEIRKKLKFTQFCNF